MKAIVEFGRPQSALPPGAPCGVSASHVCANPTEAAKLASALVHVLSGRQETQPAADFVVKHSTPRITWWPGARDAWVTVTALNGFDRGPYVAHADKDAKADPAHIKSHGLTLIGPLLGRDKS